MANTQRGRLSGTSVIVAGAGLAGLSAARALEADGARVAIVEARERVGGRVLTIRDGFAQRQHAEAGADLIEESQLEVLDLAKALRLQTVRILRTGWGFYGADRHGRRRIHRAPATFGRAARLLKREVHDYCLAGERWDSAVGQLLGRHSVAEWFAALKADKALTAGLRGLRGFFLADPEDLSVLPLVEQFAADGAPGGGGMYRLRGGTSRLPETIAEALEGSVLLNTILRRVSQDEKSVIATVEEHGRARDLRAHFLVAALPATTLRDVRFEPSLPEDQHRAIATLRYGPATRLLMQFDRRFWRRRGSQWAFGTDLPIGAVWDANEQQRGPAGILSLLAGGRASAELQQILAVEGDRGVRERLAWLGRPARLLASRTITWESEPWSRGGYAFFDPQFDPRLRSWLARPAGRILFAGEHTSNRAQGYMSGAIESGNRAAAEVRAMARLSTGTID
jgi:monoamine oxidase